MDDSSFFLVTRPLEEALKTSRKFNYVGFKTYNQPVFKIRFIDNLPPLKTGDKDLVIITSKHGAQGLLNICRDKNVKIASVGKNGPNLLRKEGFKNIIHSAANMSELVEFIKSSVELKGHKLIIVRGRVTTGGFKDKLPGFEIERHIVYETVAEQNFSAETVNLLKKGKISGILFYSSETVRIFNRLAEKAGIEGVLAKIPVFCLSPVVSGVASELGYRNLRIAAEPNERSMIELVEEYVNKR